MKRDLRADPTPYAFHHNQHASDVLQLGQSAVKVSTMAASPAKAAAHRWRID